MAAGLLGAAGVGAACAVHAAWGVGSTWPVNTSDQLADLVVGKRPMPGASQCAAVATLLGGATLVTAVGALGGPGPVPALARRASSVAAGTLLTRGVGGLVAEAVGVGDVAPEFRRWNRRLYSPLCIALGLLVGAGTRRRAA